MARILIIDDDAITLALVEDILEKHAALEYNSNWALRITAVKDPIAALDIIKKHRFELIITDILMAKMDGWELIREIRKEFPQFDVPIVVISAIDGVELEFESMKHGASAWFQKPIKPKEFAKDVFKLIQRV